MNTDNKYYPAAERYNGIEYRRSGKSGILLPAVSLGLWHNFGWNDSFENGRNMIRQAFDLGITHFDLANNYGSPFGSAEENFGRILKKDFSPYRDELFISSKAGYDMWPGPYGNWGSRKYIISSCNQSLKRMGIDYVDVFYSHRHDPATPIEETLTALSDLVKQGKALYVGISNYDVEESKKAIKFLQGKGTPCFCHQVKYSMINRDPERGLFNLLIEQGVGCTVYSPLAQGILTNKYLSGIPTGSRAAKKGTYLSSESITDDMLEKIRGLEKVAKNREQSLAQMAISWVLQNSVVSSVIMGASSPNQIIQNVKSIEKTSFSEEETSKIDALIDGV